MSEDPRETVLRLGRLIKEELDARNMMFVMLVALPTGSEADGFMEVAVAMSSNAPYEAAVEMMRRQVEHLTDAAHLAGEGDREAGHA